MIKNTASQTIGAQMVSATDGSAFTGAVTVAVTGDAGTQATGSVGSGACTHEGSGYHTYAPAQAETNYDLIAFTFTGTGAIPATVQVYTVAGDAFTRLGAPAGVSVSADVAAVKAETATIVADTNELQTDWANGGRLDLILDARASQTSVDDVPTVAEFEARTLLAASYATAAALTAVDDFLDTEIAAILAAVDTEVAAILALLDDARTEPGQGAPPVNPDLATKVDYLYKFARNKVTQTSTTLSIYDDAGTTVDHKSTVSDDATTYTRGEIVAGP